MFVRTLVINAPAVAVVDAFFDPQALANWWEVSASLCVPRPLGSYALEWQPTEWRDHILGRLGGSFHGTVMDFQPGREFFVADLFWHPPDGDVIGPMALEVTCSQQADVTRLRLKQAGYNRTNARWTRYYEILPNGWGAALDRLKHHLEQKR